EGIRHEDLEPTLISYLYASSFDIITDTVYYWRNREDGSSISQQKASQQNLNDRLSVTATCAEHILQKGDANIRNVWCRKIFTIDILQFIEEVPRTDQEYFNILSTGTRNLIERLGSAALQAVPIYPRLAADYLSRG